MKDVLSLLQRWSPLDAPTLRRGLLADIEDLEEKVGSSLPEAYRTFLSVMGEGLGALEIDEADFRLSRIRERYDIMEWKPPPRLICIGVDLAPMGRRSFYLDRARPVGTDDAMVLRFSYEDRVHWEEEATAEHASLRELLVYWGFMTLRAPTLPYFSTLIPELNTQADVAQRRTERLLEAAENLGAPRLPLSEVARVYDGEAMALLVDREPLSLELRSVRLGAIDLRTHQNHVALMKDLGLNPL